MNYLSRTNVTIKTKTQPPPSPQRRLSPKGEPNRKRRTFKTDRDLSHLKNPRPKKSGTRKPQVRDIASVHAGATASGPPRIWRDRLPASRHHGPTDRHTCTRTRTTTPKINPPNGRRGREPDASDGTNCVKCTSTFHWLDEREKAAFKSKENGFSWDVWWLFLEPQQAARFMGGRDNRRLSQLSGDKAQFCLSSTCKQPFLHTFNWTPTVGSPNKLTIITKLCHHLKLLSVNQMHPPKLVVGRGKIELGHKTHVHNRESFGVRAKRRVKMKHGTFLTAVPN